MHPSTLLLVDDHPQVLQLRKQDLEAFGYRVLTASNPRSAISVLEKTSITAVLVEFRSEGIDAEAVAHHVKARFSKQPIVLLSAYSELPERILWLVDEYVMRSDPVEILVKKIEGLTGRHNLGTPHKTAAASNSMRPNRCVA